MDFSISFVTPCLIYLLGQCDYTSSGVPIIGSWIFMLFPLSSGFRSEVRVSRNKYISYSCQLRRRWNKLRAMVVSFDLFKTKRFRYKILMILFSAFEIFTFAEVLFVNAVVVYMTMMITFVSYVYYIIIIMCTST